jgi:hypothetical protein
LCYFNNFFFFLYNKNLLLNVLPNKTDLKINQGIDNKKVAIAQKNKKKFTADISPVSVIVYPASGAETTI